MTETNTATETVQEDTTAVENADNHDTVHASTVQAQDTIEDHQEDVQQDTDETPEEASEDEQEPKGSKANREAAKYRKRAQEAEEHRRQAQQEIEALTSQLAAARAGLVEAHLKGMNPKLFWQLAGNPDQFFTDYGSVDVDKVHARTREVKAEFGLNMHVPDPNVGRETPPEGGRPSNVADAFRPAPR